MKKVLFLTAVIGIIFAISSCKKTTSDEAVVDAFVRSLKYNNQDAYSAVFSATSNNVMAEVTVDMPGGGSFKLSEHSSGLGYSFLTDTSFVGLSYSHTPPASGLYTFHIKYADGTQQVYTNTLSSDYLLPPVIDSLYKKPDGVNLRLKWEPVAGADTYEMRISSGDNEIMPWLEYGSTTALFYERRLTNFYNYLPGTLKFEIRAVKYESNKSYVQALSYTYALIDL